MTGFRQIKIAAKLGLAFAMMLCLTVLLGLFSMFQLSVLNRDAQAIGNGALPSVRIALQAVAHASALNIDVLQHIVATNTSDMARFEDDFNVEKKALFVELESYGKHVDSPAEKSIYDDAREAARQYMAAGGNAMSLSYSGMKPSAVSLMDFKGDGGHKYLAMRALLVKLVDMNTAESETAVKDATLKYHQSQTLVIVALVAMTIVGILLAIGIARHIVQPLQTAVMVANRVAAGDLTGHIDADPRGDETGRLMAALHEMNSSLLSIVSRVRHGTDTISTASAQIAAGNQDLSSRTEEQASSLEETAASMEELTSTVRQNEDNARVASEVARAASDNATQGAEVVRDVVATMARINDSSRQIAEIIGVIDAIAFQTNILALNAAVEAARAGEQGRGFAVVATEVRNLAQRSASAAKDIKVLIEQSVATVRSGHEQADQAGRKMNDIVANVRRVSDIIGEISAASREQTLGIEQVNQAIMQMDQVTQQNAALVEQAAAAASSLEEQAFNLGAVVSSFTLQPMPVTHSVGEHDAINANTPGAVPEPTQMRMLHA